MKNKMSLPNIKRAILGAVSMLLILVSLTSKGQIVNKRLYLKSGNGLSRVVPTSGTFTSSPTLSKQSAILGVNGNVKTSSGGSTTGSLTSVAFTPTGTNRLLMVSIGSVVGANNAVSAVSCGGVSLIKLTEAVSAGFKIEFWYLKNVAASSGTLTINWPAGNNLEATVGYSCLYNVDQGSTFLTTANASGATASSSLNVPSQSGDIVIDALAVKDNLFAAGTGQTELFSAGTNSVDIRSSYKASATAAATTNMAWTGLSSSWVTVGVGIKGLVTYATFAQNLVMCSNFTIKAGQPITIVANANVVANTASGATLPIIADLSVGGTSFANITTATNSGLGASGTSGTLTWTTTLGADLTILAGQALTLNISSNYSAADIRIDFDATNKISYVELPTSSYINVNGVDVYNAAFSGGTLVTQRAIGVTNYIRSVVSDPFGFADITALDYKLNGGANLSATSVSTAGCTRTYEYAWTPTISGSYSIQGTAKEGTENTVTHSLTSNFTVVRPAVTVAVTKTSPAGALVVGNNIVYNIAITNTGLSPIATLPLQDIFSSSSLQYVAASIAPTTTASGVISWTNILGSSLAAGAVTNVTITFKVLTNTNPLNNTARVEGAKDNLNYTIAAVSNTLAVTVANAPVAVANNYYISGSTALDVLANDTDPDLAGFLSAYTAQYNVTIEVAPSLGTATVNAAKTIQFAPGAMTEDQATTFKYRVTEIATGLFSIGDVSVKFSAINNAPTATNDIAVTTNDDAVKINILANDADVDGDLQTPTITVAPKYGTAVVNADKTITYTPFAGSTGTDVLTYQICDNGTPAPALCSTATVTISVSNISEVCQQSTAIFTVDAVQGATQYIWTIPAGATVTSTYTGTLPNPITTTTSITIDWNGVTAGAYTLCAKATNNCGNGTNQCIDVNVEKIQLSNVATNVLCRNAKTGAIDLTVTGGKSPYTYAWTGPSGYVASVEDITGLAAGTYTVTVTGKYGCSASATITITQPAGSAVSVSGNVTNENPIGAYNGAVDITPSLGTSPYTYAWSTGAVSEDVNSLGNGLYTVVVSDALGCTVSKNFTVNYVGGSLMILSLTKTDGKCFNVSSGTVDLEVSGGTGSYTYAWTGPSGFTATTQDLSSLAAGTYNVTVSDGSTTVSGSVTIGQPAAALSASTTVANVTCNGAGNGAITTTVNGGTAPYTYTWSNGAVTKDLTSLAASTYNLNIVDNNGCTATASGTVTQPAAIAATGVVVNSNCATGNSGAITITPTGGSGSYTYAWSNGASTKDLVNVAPGNYSVIITDGSGCKLGKSFTVGNACLGVANTISVGPVNNLNGTYTLTYNIRLENKGTTPLSNLQLTDNIATTFTGSTAAVVGSVVSGSLTVNGSYNGTTNTNLLTAGSGTLAVGEIKYIAVTVTVTPGTKLGIYNNSVSATATDPNNLAVTDVSQNGTNVDPDIDGNPGNNSVPTPVTFVENPLIGVAKKVTANPTNNFDGSYNLTYTITVKNYGDVALKNVQVSDNLSTTFAGAPVSIVSLSSAGLTVNNVYNGTTNTNLLAGIDNLALNTSRTIVVTIRVSPASLTTYNNTAVATAQSIGGIATSDNSDNGTNPDPDNDTNPANNSVPTPVTFTETPVIGLAERLTKTPVNISDGTYQVAYTFLVKNSGDVPLNNVQIADNLSTTFAGKPLSIDSIVTGSGLTKNPSYNGTTNTNLLTGTNTLAIGATSTVTLYFKVTPGTNLGVYNNNATASANGPLGTATSDVSNNGTDMDPENDGPGNNGIPTPVSFSENPSLGLAKSASSPINNGNGTYSLTYSIKVANTGNVPLTNVQVQDKLNETFSGAVNYTVNSVSASAPFTTNNSYNGNANPNLLTTPNTLAAGGTGTITLNLSVTPGEKLGVYNNLAYGAGTSPGGTIVNDTSTVGNNVDPDFDGDPGNNDTITPVEFVENPKIGLAKRVAGAVTNNGNNTYTFTYEIKVTNAGDVPLNSLQLADDLTATFPSPATFSVNSLSVFQQPASSILVANSGYNGSTNNNLLNGTGNLATGETALLRLTLTVNPGLLGGPFFNAVTGYGLSPAYRYVVDNSQDGSDIDPDGDGNPTNNNDPTPVIFFQNPKIGLAKRVVSVTDSVNGMNKITLELKVKNFGNVGLSNLKIYDNVVSQFSKVSPSNFKALQGSLFANSAWNGTGTSNILAAGESIAVGDSGNVFVSFTVVPNRDTVLFNRAVAQGSTFTGIIVTDTSTNGGQPDANLDGDPANDSIPTPVPFILHIPVALDDSYTTPINTAKTANVSINDKLSADGGNNWSLINANGGATHGTVTMNAAGTFTYTPANNYLGTDVFTYKLCDLNNDCDTAIVNISITTSNQPPVANYNMATTKQATAVVIPILLNDSDPDNNIDPASVTITRSPANGIVTINPATGALTYTPNPTFSGRDTLIYRLCDLGMPVICDTAIVFITVKKDSDRDGIIDEIDIDDDNDGIPDAIENNGFDPFGDADGDGTYNYLDATPGAGQPAFADANSDGVNDFYDADRDGIINELDLDSDNDGIADIVEASGIDTNGDGIIDNLTDTDGDGLMNTYDVTNGGVNIANLDTDGDGIPNYKDLDSDNDGIPDVVEAGGADANNDGRIDGYTDTDGDGFADTVDGDVGNDGTAENTANALIITSAVGSTPGSPGSYLRANSDGNGLPNPYDIDADNDGIPDATEAGIAQDTNGDGVVNGSDAGYTDTNGDGWSDQVDAQANLNLPNSDGTGRPNYLDLDSDDDGIPDLVEAGGIDTNGDGVIDDLTDTDGDGLMNTYDVTNGGVNIANLDTDGDGIANYKDLDSDNDGIPDVVEAGGTDANNDGRIDGYTDTDGDGFADSVDGDLGNDGTTENTANALIITSAVGGTPGRPASYLRANADANGLPNPYDIDADNDGIPDATEAGIAQDTNGDGVVDSNDAGFTDANGDGWSDQVDVLVSLNLTNSDGTGNANYLDLDSDDDGIPDLVEAGGIDTNGDGVIDDLTDTDGDGLMDTYDVSNGGVNIANLDTDGDGTPNYKDLDSDNDGIPDVVEAGGTDANNDGRIDGYTDTDGDGFADNVDGDVGNDGTTENTANVLIITSAVGSTPGRPASYLRANADGNGMPNPYDLDADGDGIIDTREGAIVQDTNNDGVIDSNDTGFTDADGDGWSDQVDALANLNLPNSDGSGRPNYLDIDADNDGIPDNIEGQTTAGYIAPSGTDTDGDGIDDAYDNVDTNGTFGGNANNGIIPTNTDGADNPDYLDLDADNDGKPDRIEGWDTNGNGIIDGAERSYVGTTDTDGDGLLDEYDVVNGIFIAGNATNSTIPITYPDVDNVGANRDWREMVDNDKDGIVDVDDIDDDNDGILDIEENGGFDPFADTDGDGTPNYLALTPGVGQPAFTDTNGDGLNDFYDADKDGIPNSLDLDVDNDGIPDLVEAGGIDTNGDGVIDDLTDSDGDGLMDTYDVSNGGVNIANLDTDGDGIANYKDLDSDNDGIPDVVEAGGTDANNDGRIDGYTDTDGDGLSDNVDGDVGNDGTAESPSFALIITSTVGGTPGRPASYLKANADGSGMPNPYDLDADGDGINDATESGITDASFFRGMVSGCALVNGWCSLISDLSSLGLVNSDGNGKPDFLDIDSDNDGVSDNIESQSTASYVVPADADSDGDGIADVYDFFNGMGGNGITPYDHDGDGNPDHMDTDSDNDGAADRNEVDKNNQNLTQAAIDASGDTDGDGLMDIFDTFDLSAANGTNVFNNVGNSNFGPNGNFNGPNPGGSNIDIVKSVSSAANRDWRNVGLLALHTLTFNGGRSNGISKLIWNVSNDQQVNSYVVERSYDGRSFDSIGVVISSQGVSTSYKYNDESAANNNAVIYYRIKQVTKAGAVDYSQVISLKENAHAALVVKLWPNPVENVLNVKVALPAKSAVTITVSNVSGSQFVQERFQAQTGENIFTLTKVNMLHAGMYNIKVCTTDGCYSEMVFKK